MSGTRAGTGKPLFLKCSHCKKSRNSRDVAKAGRLMRTGRERPYKPRGATGRTSTTAYECKCADCGTVGWYAHHLALILPFDPAYSKDFEPGFLDTLDSLRRLKGLAEINDSGTRLWPGEIIVLVDVALGTLDRFDKDRARRQLLENFRYARK